MHGVGCLSRLADKDTHVIPEDGGASVQQVASQLQIDRQVCQALNSLPASQASMERSPTCHKHHTPSPSDAAQMVSQASKVDAAHLVRVNNNLSAHGQVYGHMVYCHWFLFRCGCSYFCDVDAGST